jgi:hydrogenase nickel incorporation protein HypB
MEIKVVQNILSANEQIAARNRKLWDEHGVLAVNLMSSPGAGKTSLILQTIRRLENRMRIAVIEGDIASTLDADRISKEGIRVVQVNTGGSCHLDANMLALAVDNLPLADIDLLLIENVGNLVCPAQFNLGEHRRAMIISCPEGDDKPYKYPLMFTIADAVLINKIDLIPVLDFNTAAFEVAIKGINPQAPIFPISCKSGEGIEAWTSWLLVERGKLFVGQR